MGRTVGRQVPEAGTWRGQRRRGLPRMYVRLGCQRGAGRAVPQMTAGPMMAWHDDREGVNLAQRADREHRCALRPASLLCPVLG